MNVLYDAILVMEICMENSFFFLLKLGWDVIFWSV